MHLKDKKIDGRWSMLVDLFGEVNKYMMNQTHAVMPKGSVW